MSQSRRDFMKDMAVVGAAAAAGTAAVPDTARADAVCPDCSENGGARCPYFDQPMYCKGLSESGKPLCEE
ncbi:MAG: twin-arginine translocation signal domain-containing protein [Candidatus Latescibacteria bacterium]|nr:twin-arginine translocation signal domain-containing protein [Candidatus Latescibacterota bacterium]